MIISKHHKTAYCAYVETAAQELLDAFTKGNAYDATLENLANKYHVEKHHIAEMFRKLNLTNQ